MDFAVGKTVINPTFNANPGELEKIRSMVETVQTDEGTSIKGITITGYASPEGSLTLNRRLSEGRAKALQAYLQERYQLSGSLYTVRFGGEDWQGLRSQVAASDMAARNEVLAVLDGTDSREVQKSRLKKLNDGSAYRSMLSDIYPKLRKVTVAVDYQVRNFDLDEAKEIARTRPQNLSLEEMYLVANTYEQGSDDFNHLFDTAVRLFPDDAIANINAALIAIARRDFVSADRYLRNVRAKIRIPEYDNAMGLLLMLRDADYDNAETYFRPAHAAGLDAAGRNLEEIVRMRGNIDRIKELELKQNTLSDK